MALASPVRSPPPSPSLSVTVSCCQLQNETQRQINACWNKLQTELYVAYPNYLPRQAEFVSYYQDFQNTEGFALLSSLLALGLAYGLPRLLRAKVVADTARTCLLSSSGDSRFWDLHLHAVLQSPQPDGRPVLRSVDGTGNSDRGVDTVCAVFCFSAQTFGQDVRVVGANRRACCFHLRGLVGLCGRRLRLGPDTPGIPLYFQSH